VLPAFLHSDTALESEEDMTDDFTLGQAFAIILPLLTALSLCVWVIGEWKQHTHFKDICATQIRRMIATNRAIGWCLDNQEPDLDDSHAGECCSRCRGVRDAIVKAIEDERRAT